MERIKKTIVCGRCMAIWRGRDNFRGEGKVNGEASSDQSVRAAGRGRLAKEGGSGLGKGCGFTKENLMERRDWDRPGRWKKKGEFCREGFGGRLQEFLVDVEKKGEIFGGRSS